MRRLSDRCAAKEDAENGFRGSQDPKAQKHFGVVPLSKKVRYELLRQTGEGADQIASGGCLSFVRQ